MRGRLAITLALAIAFAVLAARISQAGPPVSAKLGACPRGALALSPQDLRTAKRVVFRFAIGKWAKASGLKTRGAHVSGARTAPHWEKGGFVKTKCGTTIWRRTAVISLLYPAMYYSDSTAPGPCNACAGVAFLTSRTSHGWVIWYTL